jgi:hypothetical protein
LSLPYILSVSLKALRLPHPSGPLVEVENEEVMFLSFSIKNKLPSRSFMSKNERRFALKELGIIIQNSFMVLK